MAVIIIQMKKHIYRLATNITLTENFDAMSNITNNDTSKKKALKIISERLNKRTMHKTAYFLQKIWHS